MLIDRLKFENKFQDLLEHIIQSRSVKGGMMRLRKYLQNTNKKLLKLGRNELWMPDLSNSFIKNFVKLQEIFPEN